ncbi:MAG: hypothetical protein HY901_31950 [Deltaproteobacteria bacterium]|nr:hypothetical protein [Deltaproteobacteria bacterium]
MTRRLNPLFWLAVAAALFCACPNEVDRAAKKRIFSPEEPPKAKLAAAEPIAVDEIAESADSTYRVLAMSAAEAFERIGPFRFKATASFDWTYGKEAVSLSEQRSLEQASALEYALHTENSRDYGMDLVRLTDRTFAKSKYHPFRERKRDRGQSDLMREDVFGALRSAQTLLSNRLALVRDRQEDVLGRKAKRFNFMISEKPLRALGPDPWKLPPVQYPANGPDEATKRRVDFENLRKPRSVEGAVWVDLETGVPLKSQLTATIIAPGEEQDEARLVLKIQTELKPSAEPIAIAAPESFLPDQDRPTGIAAALERFDMKRADAGVASGAPSKPADAEDSPED